MEGFGLLLAKGCGCIAAMNPCKQKHPSSSSSSSHQWFDKGSDPENRTSWVWRGSCFAGLGGKICSTINN